MTRLERDHWEARYRATQGAPGLPSPFLVEHRAELPGATALDVACGRGRHAVWLARHGFRVDAVDISEAALRDLHRTAAVEALPIRPIVADLASFPLGQSRYDVVVNVNFLHRPLLPQLAATLRPGGVLVFETFLLAQAHEGHPKNPAYLLAPGELRDSFAPRLEILEYREGAVDRGGSPTHLASLLARRA